MTKTTTTSETRGESIEQEWKTCGRGVFGEDFDPILLLCGSGGKHLKGLLGRAQLESMLDFWPIFI